jgi:PAS domain S-box-containing protein
MRRPLAENYGFSGTTTPASLVGERRRRESSRKSKDKGGAPMRGLGKGSFRDCDENLRAVIENAPDGILIATGDGAHIFANARASDITGYSRDELLTMGMKELADPEEIPGLAEIIRKRLAGESFPDPYATRIIDKEGRRVPVEIRATRLVCQGRAAALIFLRDISGRRKMEDELGRSEERFRSLFENATIGLYRTTPDGAILMANPALVKMLGYGSFE